VVASGRAGPRDPARGRVKIRPASLYKRDASLALFGGIEWHRSALAARLLVDTFTLIAHTIGRNAASMSYPLRRSRRMTGMGLVRPRGAGAAGLLVVARALPVVGQEVPPPAEPPKSFDSQVR